MLKSLTNLFFLSIFLFSLWSCVGKSKQYEEEQVGSLQEDRLDFSHPVALKYAKGFSVENYQDYKVLYALSTNPLDTLATYVFYLNGTTKPQLGDEVVYVSVPIERMITTSTVQIGAVAALKSEDVVVGTPELRYVGNDKIHQRVANQEAYEIAKGMSQDLERILSLEPDVLLVDMIRNADEQEKLDGAGIPTILFNSWMDQTLLGRAEWMKVIGILVGENRLADSLFLETEKRYQNAQSLLADVKDEIPIMYGQDYKGAWYVPGELSYIAGLFREAKLAFDCIPNQTNSEPKSFEYVFARNRSALIWFTSFANDVDSVSEFVAQNERYAHFDATKKGKIISDRKRVNKYGGNDYWETAPYEPYLLLMDVIKVTRPELLPDYETTYWKELSR